jgi:hypothetical protein
MGHKIVMAGLVPAIHVFLASITAKTWMPGTRPGMTKVLPSGRLDPDRLDVEVLLKVLLA